MISRLNQRHAQVTVDRGVGDGLGEVDLPVPDWSDQDKVLGPTDPVERSQRPLSVIGDGRGLRVPGVERLARWQAGSLSVQLAGQVIPSGRLFDDIGLLPAGADEAEALYRLIDAAYEKRSLIVTSNLHPARFDTIFPRGLATAAVDRLLHHAHVIVTEGQSHRLTEAIAGRGVRPLVPAP